MRISEMYVIGWSFTGILSIIWCLCCKNCSSYFARFFCCVTVYIFSSILKRKGKKGLKPIKANIQSILASSEHVTLTHIFLFFFCSALRAAALWGRHSALARMQHQEEPARWFRVESHRLLFAPACRPVLQDSSLPLRIWRISPKHNNGPQAIYCFDGLT